MTVSLALDPADEALLADYAAREKLSVSDFVRRTVMEKIGAERFNQETLEAMEEVRRMKADPSIGKSYTDVDEMMRELLA